MRKSQRKAIDFKIVEVVTDLKYKAYARLSGVTEQPDGVKQARLRQTFEVLAGKFVSDGADEISDYCIEVGLRDPKEIAEIVSKALIEKVVLLGLPLARAHEAGDPGVAQKQALAFEVEVQVIAARALGRATIAVEKKRGAETRLDRIQHWFKDNPVGVLFAIVAAVVAFAGGLVALIGKLRS